MKYERAKTKAFDSEIDLIKLDQELYSLAKKNIFYFAGF
jgi:hypothetical protein